MTTNLEYGTCFFVSLSKSDQLLWSYWKSHHILPSISKRPVPVHRWSVVSKSIDRKRRLSSNQIQATWVYVVPQRNSLEMLIQTFDWYRSPLKWFRCSWRESWTSSRLSWWYHWSMRMSLSIWGQQFRTRLHKLSCLRIWNWELILENRTIIIVIVSR